MRNELTIADAEALASVALRVLTREGIETVDILSAVRLRVARFLWVAGWRLVVGRLDGFGGFVFRFLLLLRLLGAVGVHPAQGFG